MYELILSLVVFLFPLAYSPGPGNLFFAANGARFGLVATIPANLGYHVATWGITAAIGFGLLAALDEFPHLFLVLKISGGIYVLWIAWKLFCAGSLDSTQDAKPARFIDGVILLVLNPKAYVIITLMFSHFLSQTTVDYVTKVLLITTVFTLNNLVAFTIWTVLGDSVASYFRSPTTGHRLNRIFGVLLALVGFWMIVA